MSHWRPSGDNVNKSGRYQFSLLCVDRVAELQQSLKLVVLGEGDYLHHCPKFTEDLQEANSDTSIREYRSIGRIPIQSSFKLQYVTLSPPLQVI